VVLLGRRGPEHAAFTNPELRELGEMTGVDVQVDPAELEGVEEPEEPTKRRNVEILRSYAERGPGTNGRRISLKFRRSPVEILGDEQVTGLRIVRNRIEDGRAVPTGEEEVIGCGLVFRSIGYTGKPVGDVPFDPARGLIRNDGGRVCDEQGVPHRGEYVVGWIKRGPSGVIGTNKKDANETVEVLLEDLRDGARKDRPAGEIEELLAERGTRFVLYPGWTSIDALERAAGEKLGRPRVKLVTWDDLLEAAEAIRR
jgi:ferredoxin/flavodoxin---NADP+ reductase